MADRNPSAPGSHAVMENLTEADKMQGVPHTGVHATTAAAGGIGHENAPEPALFGGYVNGTVVVSLAMLVFVAILLWKKVPSIITGGLDKQIAAIKAQLADAAALRAEAEALRDDYQRRIAAAQGTATDMIAHAQAEADALVAKAKADADELVGRRATMAQDKIAAAERAALAEIRARTADAASRAAASLIADAHGAAADKALVDRTIAGLARA